MTNTHSFDIRYAIHYLKRTLQSLRRWSWRSRWHSLWYQLPSVSTVVLIAAFVFLVAVTVAMFAFLSVDLAGTAAEAPPRWADSIARWTLRLVGRDVSEMDAHTYRQEVALSLSKVTLLVAIWLAIVPAVSLLRYRKGIRDAAPVKINIVHEKGVHDLRHMYRYFRDADYIAIFSGDFDWILKHEPLRKLLVRLADRAKPDLLLVSYRNEGEIENRWSELATECSVDDWKDILDKLKRSIRFHERDFKFSMIRIGTHWSFLSLVKKCPAANLTANVGVHSIKGTHADAIVTIVQRLCDLEGCEQNLRRWGQADRSRALEGTSA